MDTVYAMRVFARVAEVQSFTGAAAQLGISKATASATVTALEAQLGTRLLHRTTRHVRLTPDGQICYDRGRALLAEVEALVGLFQRDEGEIRGALRVDMPLGVANDLVVPALPAFLAAHPGLTVHLSSTDRRVDLVREGYDCVLRIGVLSSSSLIARFLGHYRIINCVSPAYLATHGMPEHPNDLANHRLVHYANSGGAVEAGFEYVPLEGGEPVMVPMAGALTVDNSTAYTAACLAGLGIIQTPAMGIQQQLAKGELVEVLPGFQAAPMPASLIYPHREYQPERVRVFMDWLSDLVRPRLMP